MAIAALDSWPVEEEVDFGSAFDIDLSADGAGLVEAVAFDID